MVWSHWQILWRLAQGKSVPFVAEVTGYYKNWIYQAQCRYNQYGPDGLGDQRHHNPGGYCQLGNRAEHYAKIAS
jgi:hypothetical protein